MYRQIRHKTIADSGEFSISPKTMSFIPEYHYMGVKYIKTYYY